MARCWVPLLPHHVPWTREAPPQLGNGLLNNNSLTITKAMGFLMGLTHTVGQFTDIQVPHGSERIEEAKKINRKSPPTHTHTLNCMYSFIYFGKISGFIS